MHSLKILLAVLVVGINWRCVGKTSEEMNEIPVKLNLSVEAEMLRVDVKNTSSEEINIWEESCSWGWGIFYFVFTDCQSEEIKAKVTRKETVWTRNFPKYFTLQPNETKMVEFNLGDGIWKTDGLDALSETQPVCTKAILQIPEDEQTKEHQVITGEAQSNELQLDSVKEILKETND